MTRKAISSSSVCRRPKQGGTNHWPACAQAFRNSNLSFPSHALSRQPSLILFWLDALAAMLWKILSYVTLVGEAVMLLLSVRLLLARRTRAFALLMWRVCAS